MMPYERLKAWETAHQLVLAVYRETRGWPSEERFGLTAQARRAAVSVTSNLAEGSARLGGRELRRFADIALGSLAELASLLWTARDLGYLPKERWAALNALRDSAGKLVYGLARALSKPPGSSSADPCVIASSRLCVLLHCPLRLCVLASLRPTPPSSETVTRSPQSAPPRTPPGPRPPARATRARSP